MESGDRLHRVGAADRRCVGLRKPEALHLARLNQLLHGAGDVFDGHTRIDSVLIKEIDGLYPKSLERLLGDPFYLFRPAIEPGLRARALLAVLETELGGDHDLSAKWLERLTDEFLVGEGSVHLCSIEKSDSSFDRRTNQRDHLLPGPDRAIAEAHSHAAQPKG